MDSPAVDGADSAEDLRSSLPYRSTLPGIPKVIVLDYCLLFKSDIFIEAIFDRFPMESSQFVNFIAKQILHFSQGIARQLFQHLQGPMEESTIKSQLEKIIILGRKQHRRTKVCSLLVKYINVL